MNWGEPFLVRSVSVRLLDVESEHEDTVIQIRECLLCGAPVSEELLTTHKRFHADTPVVVGSQLAKPLRATTR
jgi:hypothetical protein